MDTERLKITLETTGIRTRGWMRFSLSVVGVAFVLVGAYNLLLAPATGGEVLFPVYRTYLSAVAMSDGGIVHLADVALMGTGAILGWFS